MSDLFNQALAGKRGKHQQLIAEAVASAWAAAVLICLVEVVTGRADL